MTTTGRRPTPGDPTPSTTPEHLAPSRIVRNLPPELGPNAVAVLEGLTLDPQIPEPIGRIEVTGTSAFGSRWDIEATRTQYYVRLSS